MENQFDESLEGNNPYQNTPMEKPLFSPATMEQFLGAAKWAKVISVIYLTLIVLAVIALLISASSLFLMLGNIGRSAILLIGVVFYAALIGVVFYMLYKLYSFSKYARNFSVSRSEQDLKLAFTNLRQFFLNIVIMMLVAFVFYLIMAGWMMLFASNMSSF